jgi:hypothetical protein
LRIRKHSASLPASPATGKPCRGSFAAAGGRLAPPSDARRQPLLGITAILERDGQALVTVLPSDHYVAEEDILRRSLSRALALAEAESGARAIHFLGIKPETADRELGYIVRGEPLVERRFPIEAAAFGSLWRQAGYTARRAQQLGRLYARLPEIDSRATSSRSRMRSSASCPCRIVSFYEYFHGDTGRGVGASHQTGWTGLIAKLLMPPRGHGAAADAQ